MKDIELPFDIERFDVHEDFIPILLEPLGPELYEQWAKDWNAFVTDDEYFVERFEIDGFDGRKVPLIAYRSKELVGKKLPCIIHIHGGGFLGPLATSELRMCQRWVKNVGCAVISVDYTLSTRAPFPAAAEDCYMAAQWIWENSDGLNIDRNRLAVAGPSAGGNLAAALCLMLRDRGSNVKLCLQILLVAELDTSFKQESHLICRSEARPPVLSTESLRQCCALYLKDGIPEGMNAYAAPLQAESLADLPPAYIEPADFDPLRDESIDYATELTVAGVPVTFVQTRRTPHTWDNADTSYTERYKKFRDAFLMKSLG